MLGDRKFLKWKYNMFHSRFFRRKSNVIFFTLILTLALHQAFSQSLPDAAAASYTTCVGMPLQISLPRPRGIGMKWALRPNPKVSVTQSTFVTGDKRVGAEGLDTFELVFREPGLYFLSWDLKRPYESKGEVFSVIIKVIGGDHDEEK